MSYVVVDSDGEEYEGGNPRLCPGARDDNYPTSASLSNTTSSFTWVAPTEADSVYGYKVTLSRADADTGVYTPLVNWAGKLFRTYGVTLPSGGLSYDSSTGTYTLTTGLALVPGTYRAEVTTFNLDGAESTAATAAAVKN